MAERDLRIIFMGTPEFAVPSLKILVENNYNVVAVVTATDKPAGRGLKLTPSAVKKYAVEADIPVLQPSNMKSPEFLAELSSYKPNLGIVVAFRMLPEAVWKMPEYGTFNLHASLLPDYRGAAPINWAIINGESKTGITTFFLKHEIDTGDIMYQEEEPIYPDDNAESLYTRLMTKGAELVLNTVVSIQKGIETTKPQVISGTMKSAPKITKETCKIDWNKPSKEIQNLVRGLSPYPGAWTILNDKFLKIYTITPAENVQDSNQTILTDNKTYLFHKTGDGYIAIKDLQMEGKKRMTIEEFLRGNKL
ncbi:MAG: methionyl-tRNA formyltransferase [Cytophagaceae bacterium]